MSSSYQKVLNSIKSKTFFRELSEKLREKRIIFTVTTGRSGTGYLATVLSHLPNVHAFHEPEPNFVWVMRRAIEKPEVALKFLAYKKLPAIAELPYPVYCETSHLFCKGFFHPLLDLGFLPEIVILKRERRKVAKSLFELNTIPGRTPLALSYYLKPDDKGVYLPIKDWNRLHDYQLCYWYCLEIEKRMEVYKEELLSRGGKVYQVNLLELQNLETLLSFLKNLNLPLTEETIELLRKHVGRKVNTKKDIKVRRLESELTPEQIEELEREVEKLVDQNANRSF